MSPLSVAIIGCPNVGKSTLFNRIVQRPTALVDGAAGVTRDRHYGEAEWLGRSFQLIDTGGIVTEQASGLMHAIRKQTEHAIAEADLILFVVDARQGVTSGDQEIALQLHKTGKRVLLVANKVEVAEVNLEIPLVYRLGFGEPFLISAEHGQGVGDLLDAVLREIPEAAAPREEERGVQVAIVGRPNVGKSSLINRILGQHRLLVDHVPGTTRDTIDSVVRVNKQCYTLIDTAGMRKSRHINESLEKAAVMMSLKRIRRCDVAVLLLDAVSGVGAQDAHMATYIEDQGKACIIALNKWDAVEKTSQTYESFVHMIQEAMPFLSHVPMLSLSAMTGQRVVKLFPLIDAVFAEARRRVSTAQLNEFLQTVTRQHPAPMYRGRFVKFSFLVQTVVQPPTFFFFVNYPEGVTNFYKRYLENKLRQYFGFAGVPIRLRFRKK
jgi:GTP-binding protein